MDSAAHGNPTFIDDDGKIPDVNNADEQDHATTARRNLADTENTDGAKTKQIPERDTWGKGVEFLMSCIAMSIGLGNVWRFPFTALENGGGAFLIPYLIVLFLIGKPIYYLEMIIGQFSSRGSVKVFDLCPAMRGIGIGQVFMVFMLGTYYESICALIGYYLVESFRDPLPWAYCRPEYGENCIDSTPRETRDNIIQWNTTADNDTRIISSSEFYFVQKVLREKENINDGIGAPNWELVLSLFASWLCVFLVIIRGVKSSGKASYFLALFPYLIMGILLVHAATLPGAGDGILYFIKPDWSRILEPGVWYNAVTQCFFSLSVCFGNIIMYSSYNRFDHNIHRDQTIITILDTCTSLIAGFTIFGILGHLAHEIGTDDIGSVIKNGPGIAFISYPDAIAKFKTLPQIFSVLFFLMLFVLGIGSNIAMTSCTVTAIRDRFPKIKQWQCALGVALVSFCIGLSYVTPGGQFILTLVDYFGASMIALILAIAELYTIGWVYGTNRICKDVEFMLNRKVGVYWRICWSVLTPLIMTLILLYFLVDYKPLTYNGIIYPDWAYGVGWFVTALGVLQVPIWFIVAVIRQPGATLSEKIRGSFRPKHEWGPTEPLLHEQYNKKVDSDTIRTQSLGFWASIKENIFG